MNGILIGFCGLFCCWLVARCYRFVKFSKEDRRSFFLFWVWPSLYFCHQHLLQIWRCDPRLYQVAFVLICVGLFIDGFYYFLLKSRNPKGLRRQIFSASCFLLAIIFVWSLQRKPTGAVPLLVPHYDKAWVWRKPLWNPTEFYFMKPQRVTTSTTQAFQDPNYGQAIFAPCSGSVVGFDSSSQLLHITPDGFEGTEVHIGPFLQETLRTTAGQTLVAGQPLGLQSASGLFPGIQVQIRGQKAGIFTEFLSGQLWARQTQKGLPQRNQTVASVANQRFQLRTTP